MSTTDNQIYKGEVVAIGRGYYGDAIRDPGDRFYYVGVLGEWMQTPEQEAAAKAEEEARAAILAKQAAKGPAAQAAEIQSRMAALDAREKALAEREAAAAAAEASKSKK